MLQIVIYKKLNFWEEYTPLFSALPEEMEKISNYCPHIVSLHILLKSFVAGEEREKIFCGDKSSGGSCCCFSKESQPVHKLKYNFIFVLYYGSS